ncbi:MAG: DUF721 domain-containing protein [Candidatus Delongbacteria bacterium]|nr:DUF721 domain-containing protein [Candidatus Delongbacteria bacterium]MDD4205080.1 DUF721 domain-containing protein [Candidatus Delongbacteria bacterium]MDY0016694.1 DUF721 domain-containing protein [Candidatus Delongbacteria bacterium]
MKKRPDHTYNAPRRIPGLNSVLNSLVSTTPELSKLGVVLRVLKAWNETVGEKLGKVTRVIKYENEVLFVRVTSSVWRNEFYHIEDEIKTKLRGKLGSIKIKKIVFL